MIRFRNCCGKLAGARRPLAGLIILALALGLVLPQAAQAAVSKATGSLNVARAFHTATTLPDGRVLVVGGQNAGGVLDSVEIYDPATGKWTILGTMSTPRVNHTATLMKNGKVMVAGGQTTPRATSRPWLNLSAAQMEDGKVPAPGGQSKNVLSSVEVIDPATGQLVPIEQTWSLRSFHVSFQAFNQVVVAGGSDGQQDLKSGEYYDPEFVQPHWTYTADMPQPFSNAGLLVNNAWNWWWTVGGKNGDVFLNTVTSYNPDFHSWFSQAPLITARAGAWAFPLTGYTAIAGGGYNSDGPLSSTEFYSTQTWSSGPAIPVSLGGPVLAQDPHSLSIYHTGGWNDLQQGQTDTYRYDHGVSYWFTDADLLYGTAYHTLSPSSWGGSGLKAGNNNTFLKAGGMSNSTTYVSYCEIRVENVDITAPLIPIIME
jgi:hypothetical protein